MDNEKFETFKNAVALDIQEQYPKVDYLSSTIPNAMARHKHLLDEETAALQKELGEARERHARDLNFWREQTKLREKALKEREAELSSLRKAVGEAVQWIKAVGSIGMLPCDMECIAKALDVLTPTANKRDAPASKPDCETCKRNGDDCTHQEIPKACVCDQYAPENKGDAPVMMRGCQSTDCEVHICRHAVDHVRQDGCEGNDEGCPPCIPVKDGVK